MVRFYVMCGPAGAGKSTKAKEILDRDYDHSIIISSDFIRKDFFGDETDQSHNCEVFSIARQMIQTSFGLGFDNVIFDATNLTHAGRKRVLRWVKQYECEKIAVAVYPLLEECLRRNQKRERHVPEDVIERQYMVFQVPIKEEGFDDVQLHFS